ncbi:endonuclease/exonuclease/phosphatase family protein [Pseudomonas sp. RIT-PI-AD]|uniref:endonuclease/exonuclease/phosphatase family protein n=1 Tax=Pseudomonas sp. RIT-PI-AD TaxID=3035294 RepID=UPI0021D97B3D|nr:endonuclease/exonuclease/phosphatase family protein [Pseudomonas sp. RIT-PI-AD]
MPRFLRSLSFGLALVVLALSAVIYSLTWHPAQREPAASHCAAPAPALRAGQALKVMTWNLQYLAGKGYLFWNDLADGSGPDERPTPADLAHTLDEAARVLRDERPDLVLLQELHDGAKASDYQDQLALLEERLADLYPCTAQAFYWKSAFVPHPRILGSVGMKLAVLSRYRIDSAERLQLPLAHGDPLARQFGLKRALLVARLPIAGGGSLAVLDTHLDAPLPGDDTLPRQLAKSLEALGELDAAGTPWIFGGDLAAAPPGQAERLAAILGGTASDALAPLYGRYPMIPALEEADGAEQARWLTHFPNDPRVSAPDRTSDYLFHSPGLTRLDAQVRQRDTLRISTHLPLSARLLLPAAHP